MQEKPHAPEFVGPGKASSMFPRRPTKLQDPYLVLRSCWSSPAWERWRSAQVQPSSKTLASPWGMKKGEMESKSAGGWPGRTSTASKYLVTKKTPLGKGEHLVPRHPPQLVGAKEGEQKGHSWESRERHGMAGTIQHRAATKPLCPVSSAHKDGQHQHPGGRGSMVSPDPAPWGWSPKALQCEEKLQSGSVTCSRVRNILRRLRCQGVKQRGAEKFAMARG